MIKKITIGLILLAIISLLFVYLRPKTTNKFEKKFDDTIKYKINTYKPYDIKYFYDRISKTSKKGFKINIEKPDYLNKNISGTNSLLVICSPHFLPNKAETVELTNFLYNGNDIYLSAFTIAPNFIDSLVYLEEEAVFYNQWPPIPNLQDSVSIIWHKSNKDSILFEYPGKSISFYNEGYLSKIDTMSVLSSDKDGGNALVRIQIGLGNLYFQMRPITMTNYFLLHKQNYRYLNVILDSLQADKKTIIWDDFYRKHPTTRADDEESELGESYFWEVLRKNPALKWAVYTLVLSLILFVLIHSRRVEKPLAIIPELKNTTYDFIKAMAGLYWLRKDHKKITDKITQQIQDFLYTKYNIYPKEIILENKTRIAIKTNKKDSEVEEIINQINEFKTKTQISNKELINFYTNAYKFTIKK